MDHIDPENSMVDRFIVTVTYGNNEAVCQVELDSPLLGQLSQYEGFPPLLRELGKALITIAENPKAIQYIG